jgi:hypothetical protein
LGRHRTNRRLKASCDQLDAALDQVRDLLDAARSEHADIPGRVPLGEVALDARAAGLRNQADHPHLPDRGLQHRVGPGPASRPHYARAAHEARSLMREALTVAGDLHVTDGRVHTTLNALSAPRRTRALAAICQQLCDTETVYSGTDLVLHYTVKPPPSTTWTTSRCRDSWIRFQTF